MGWRVGRTDWLSILEVLSPSTLRGRSRSWDLILGDGEAQKGALSKRVTWSCFQGVSENSCRALCEEWLELGVETG